MFDVAIVGAGVVGLSTALAVQKKLGGKAAVTIFAEDFSPNTTGDVAAGLWYPYLLSNTPTEKIVRWSMATYDYVLRLWKEGKAREMGISLQTIVALSTKDSQLPEWKEFILGYSEVSKEQIEEYSKRYNEKFTGGLIFVGFIWEASKFLPIMRNTFLQNGGRIIQKTIQNFTELSNYDTIVNCSGLNSKFLVPDPLVHPIRGQIARVEAPWQYHALLFESQNTKYVIPNQECVILGGTSQIDDFNMNIDEKDMKEILDGCFKYVPPLSNARVIRHQVGLRPGRDSLRLETEERKFGDKTLKIVHNYGHGGSGITVCVGCAEETAQLVAETLGEGPQSKL